MQKHKQKMSSEERASGIDPEMTEIDIMLEEICEKEEVAEEEDETKEKKAKAEKESAEKMRLKAMEKLSDSQKRKDSNDEARPKKSRKSVGYALTYLQDKSKTSKEPALLPCMATAGNFGFLVSRHRTKTYCTEGYISVNCSSSLE